MSGWHFCCINFSWPSASSIYNNSLGLIFSPPLLECGEREEKDMEKPVRKTMIDELLEEKRERTSYYDTEEHDWITEQEMGSSIMRETDNLWIPVKRFLTKHKKTKWGEWDGLHIEEEEL